MTFIFLAQQWKAFWRSSNTGKSIAIRIVMAVFVLYLLTNILFLSFFLDQILKGVFPGQDVITSFNGLLLYYFLFDLLTRYQMQELPTLSVQPYLHLPVKRNKIVNYLSLTSLFSAFTIAPFILCLPFLIKVLLPQWGAAPFAALLVCIWGFNTFNHFFILWLKRKENVNSWFMLLFLLLLAAVAFHDFYWHGASVSHYSSLLFSSILAHPVYSAGIALLGLGMYMLNYTYLKSNLYLEELFSSSSTKKSGSDYPFLNRFGKVGDLAATEIKLILRNKRPKSTVTKGALFLFYGLIFYQNPKFGDNLFALMFCPMLMTGMFIINYGQFMFGWQSGHFDGILTNKISVRDFFRSKFLIFTIISGLTFLLTTPYVYFGWKILMMHTVMFAWNLGVNTVLVLYFANLNFKRIDLSKGASFNWEGTGASQWILSIPLMVTPLLVFLPFWWLGYSNAGIVAVAMIALICLFARQFWLNLLVNKFNANRYKIAEGFRNE